MIKFPFKKNRMLLTIYLLTKRKQKNKILVHKEYHKYYFSCLKNISKKLIQISLTNK